MGCRCRWRVFGSEVRDVERHADAGYEKCLDEDSGRHCVTVSRGVVDVMKMYVVEGA